MIESQCSKRGGRGDMTDQLNCKNKLYYGDNLGILREEIADSSIDLCYLDPPFNSRVSYNVLFKESDGTVSDAQIHAFEDTWHWSHESLATYHEIIEKGHGDLPDLIEAFHKFLGSNDVMAYITMMAARLVELHRVLKPTGSLFLHCDPTASHYLKLVLDSIFGPKNFRNEIVWRRYGAHNDVGQGSKHFGRVHDVIFFYAKSDNLYWKQLFRPLSAQYIKSTYRNVEEGTDRRYRVTPLTAPGGAEKGNPVFEWNGHTRAWRYSKETMARLDKVGKLYYSKTGYPSQKTYLDESKGVPVQDIWDDIASLSGPHKERLGYPTQKPLALMERIIEAACPPDGVILDAFAGCGTTIAAAEKLNRRWIGIDITYLATSLLEYRLNDAFGESLKPYEVHGVPKDLAGAKALAEQDRFQFQFWAFSLVKAFPLEKSEKKKGADRGIDGVLRFFDDDSGKAKRIIVSVKSGKVQVKDVRDLVGTVTREGAAIGALITLENPTKPMLDEAIEADCYYSPMFDKVPKIQILTIEGLLNKTESLKYFKMQDSTFQQAPKVKSEGKDEGLF